MRLNKGKKQTYQKRIYLLTVSIALLVVTVFTWSIYGSVRRTMLNREMEQSNRLMQQINHNINTMADLMQDSTSQIFSNVYVQELMYMDARTPLPEITRCVNRLKDLYLPTNPAIHSIYVYNEPRRQFYAVRNGIYSIDEAFESSWSEEQLFDRDYPMLRISEDGVVCTYLQRENYARFQEAPCAAAFVNFNIRWLLESMDLCKDKEKGEMLFLMDDANHMLDAGQLESHKVSQHLTTDLYLLDQRRDHSREMAEVCTLNDTPYLLTTTTNRELSLRVYYLVPNESIYAPIQQVFRILLLFNLAAILLLLGLYYQAAKWLYRPVGKIVQMLPEQHAALAPDEFTAVEMFYHQQLQEIERLRMEAELSSKQFNMTAINRLLHQSHALSETEFRALQRMHPFRVSYDRPYTVCLISFDDLQAAEQQLKGNGHILAVKWLYDTVEETVCSRLTCDYAYSDRNRFVLILQQTEEEKRSAVLREFQQRLQVHFQLSASIAVSDLFQDFQSVCDAYVAAQHAMQYRLIYGSSCLITWDMTNRRREQNMHFHSESEARMMEALSGRDYDKIPMLVERFTDECAQLEYSALQVSISLLFAHVKRTVYLLNEERTLPVDLEKVGELFCEQKLQYLSELPGLFEQLIQLLEEKEEQVTSEDLLRQACGLVQQNFSDVGLSATYLAEQLRISPIQLGRMFKKHLNQSIPEYIKHVRMEHAKQWLQNSDLTVGEIAERVGYLNESYFFRIFKEEYGMTPRQFQRSIREKPEKP